MLTAAGGSSSAALLLQQGEAGAQRGFAGWAQEAPFASSTLTQPPIPRRGSAAQQHAGLEPAPMHQEGNWVPASSRAPETESKQLPQAKQTLLVALLGQDLQLTRNHRPCVMP